MLLSFPFLAIAWALTSLTPSVHALNSTSEACCRVYPDPHFQTWHSTWYDFHGDCDIVLIKSSFLNLHMRAVNFGGWSGAVNASVQIGSSTLEIATSLPDNHVLVDGLVVTPPPLTFAGYPLTYVTSLLTSYTLDFDGTQYCNITRSYINTLMIECCAHGSDFGDATAMCGHWVADAPDNLVGRDGITLYPYTPLGTKDFGEEWEVSAPPDTVILSGTAAENCSYTESYCQLNPTQCTFCVDPEDPDCGNCDPEKDPDCDPRPQDGDIGRNLLTPEEACAVVTEDLGYRENCLYDTNTTGWLLWAKQIAYVEPLLEPPPSQCVEEDTDKECDKRGGTCVWRCDKREFDCETGLCTATPGAVVTGGDIDDDNVVDGCTCALPHDTLLCQEEHKCFFGFLSARWLHFDFWFICIPFCTFFWEQVLLDLDWKCGFC